MRRLQLPKSSREPYWTRCTRLSWCLTPGAGLPVRTRLRMRLRDGMSCLPVSTKYFGLLMRPPRR